jgi:hypothetical protein
MQLRSGSRRNSVANEEHVALLKPGVEVSRADLLSGLHGPLLSVRWPHPFGLTQHRSDTPGVGDQRQRRQCTPLVDEDGSPVLRAAADRPAPEWLYALWCTLFETVLFSRTCAKKKTAHKRRPESREETPKEANAAAMLHCNNDLGTSLVQRKRRIKCLPLFFAKLRDFGASLSTAPHHLPLPHTAGHPIHRRSPHQRRLTRLIHVVTG